MSERVVRKKSLGLIISAPLVLESEETTDRRPITTNISKQTQARPATSIQPNCIIISNQTNVSLAKPNIEILLSSALTGVLIFLEGRVMLSVLLYSRGLSTIGNFMSILVAMPTRMMDRLVYFFVTTQMKASKFSAPLLSANVGHTQVEDLQLSTSRRS